MTGAPQVSIILISYRTRDITLRCLSLLTERPGAVDSEIIVVDNASGDGSAEAIEEAFPQVRLHRLAENVGWGRAVNRAAMLSEARYLLLLNPDTEPLVPIAAELVDFATRHPGHGIYAGRTVGADLIDDGFSCWGLPSLWSLACSAFGATALGPRWRLTNPESLPHLSRDQVQRVPAASGCVMLVERELFERLGGFDPRYFMYSEDIDLSLRAARLGAKPLLDPAARVIHIGGASSSSTGQRSKILRGKVTYMRTHWSRPRAGLGVAILTSGIALRALATRVLTAASRPPGLDWLAVWRDRHEWRGGWPEVHEARPGQQASRPSHSPSRPRG